LIKKKIEDDAVRKLSNLKKQEYETKVKADDKKIQLQAAEEQCKLLEECLFPKNRESMETNESDTDKNLLKTKQDQLEESKKKIAAINNRIT